MVSVVFADMEELESLLSPGRRIQALRTGGRDREVVVTFEGGNKREVEGEGGGGSKRRRVAYHTKAYPDWGREARQRTPGGGRAAGGAAAGGAAAGRATAGRTTTR